MPDQDVVDCLGNEFFIFIFGRGMSSMWEALSWGFRHGVLKGQLKSESAACEALSLEMASSDEGIKIISEILRRNGIAPPSNMDPWIRQLAKKGKDALEKEVMTDPFKIEIDSLRKDLQSKEADNKKLKAQVESKDTANKELQKELKNKGNANEKLQSEIREKETVNEKLRNEKKEKDAANQKLQEEVRNEKAANKKLNDELQEKEAEIKNLKEKMGNLDDESKKLQNKLNEKEVVNKDLQEEIKNHQIGDKQLRGRLAARKIKVTTLNKALEKKDLRIRELEKQLTSLTISKPASTPAPLPNSLETNQSGIPWNLFLTGGAFILILMFVILLYKRCKPYFNRRKIIVSENISQSLPEKTHDTPAADEVSPSNKQEDNVTPASQVEDIKPEKMEDTDEDPVVPMQLPPPSRQQKVHDDLSKVIKRSLSNEEILHIKEITEKMYKIDRLEEYLNEHPLALKDKKDSYGNSLLHIAVLHLLVDAAEMLLKKGANVGALNNDLCTPLHMVFAKPRTSEENHKIIKVLGLLLNRKYNKDRNKYLNRKNINGETVLHAAVLQDDSVLSCLKESTVNPNIKNNKGETALHILINAILVKKKDIESLNTLLQFLNIDFDDVTQELKNLKPSQGSNADNAMIKPIRGTLVEHLVMKRHQQMMVSARSVIANNQAVKKEIIGWLQLLFDNSIQSILETLDNYTLRLGKKISDEDENFSKDLTNRIILRMTGKALQIGGNAPIKILLSILNRVLEEYKNPLNFIKGNDNNDDIYKTKIEPFKRSFILKFGNFFGVYNEIASGNVKFASDKFSNLNMLAEIATDLSNVIEIFSQEISKATSSFAKAGKVLVGLWQSGRDMRQQEQAQLFVNAFIQKGQRDIDVLQLMKVADKITSRYFDQILQLDNMGQSVLIEIMVARIVSYFKKGRHLSQSTTIQVDAPLIEEHCLEALFTETNLSKQEITHEVSRMTGNEKWFAGGVLSSGGIKVSSELYEFSPKGWVEKLTPSKQSLPKYFGYFRVTEQEFRKFREKYDVERSAIVDPFKDLDKIYNNIMKPLIKDESQEKSESREITSLGRH